MSRTNTITINGRLYDAATGMPVASGHKPSDNNNPASRQDRLRAFSDIGPRPVTTHSTHAVTARGEHPEAQAIHTTTQKSQTLYRKALKKPQSAQQTTTYSPSRSPLISKFSPNVTAHPELTAKSTPDQPVAPPQVHPTVAKIMQRSTPITAEHLSGSELKEQLIKERLEQVGSVSKKTRKAWFKRKPRVAAILTSTLALLVLGGYLTYMNLPVISMQVAASRAGVAAKFPNYKPDGYNLNGPITYSPGEVDINYKSATNDNGFKIAQKPSSWDSQGLLDNYISKQTGNYLTFQESGITVYTFGNKAAWVNGGLLYTIDGTANLSSEQILHLATSM